MDNENILDEENKEETTVTPGETETPVEDPSESEELFKLIVEDGSCIDNANSYVTVAEVDAYQTERNRSDWLSLTEDEKKSAIIRAVQYIDGQFNWKGERKYDEQFLAFPRVDPRMFDGFIRDYDNKPVKNIPRAIKVACCEAAYYGYKSTKLLYSTFDENGAVKRKKVDSLEVEYFSAEETFYNYVSKYASLNSILKGLYKSKDAKALSMPVNWRG